jgi:hypothetical protein
MCVYMHYRISISKSHSHHHATTPSLTPNATPHLRTPAVSVGFSYTTSEEDNKAFGDDKSAADNYLLIQVRTDVLSLPIAPPVARGSASQTHEPIRLTLSHHQTTKWTRTANPLSSPPNSASWSASRICGGESCTCRGSPTPGTWTGG